MIVHLKKRAIGFKRWLGLAFYSLSESETILPESTDASWVLSYMKWEIFATKKNKNKNKTNTNPPKNKPNQPTKQKSPLKTKQKPQNQTTKNDPQKIPQNPKNYQTNKKHPEKHLTKGYLLSYELEVPVSSPKTQELLTSKAGACTELKLSTLSWHYIQME